MNRPHAFLHGRQPWCCGTDESVHSGLKLWRAFSLVEVVIALGLISFALVALMGLVSIGLTGTRASGDSIEAANLAASLANRWRTNSSNLLAGFEGSAAQDAPAEVPDAGAFLSGFVNEAGETASGATDSRFKLTYAVWRDPMMTRLARLHLIFSAPPEAELSDAQMRYELQTSMILP